MLLDGVVASPHDLPAVDAGWLPGVFKAPDPPARRVVVGLDLGTSCGWSLLDADGTRIGSGAWDLSVRRGEGPGMRLLRFRKHLGELLDLAGSGWVLGYEKVERHAGTAAAHVYGGLLGQMQVVLHERGIEAYQGVPVGTVKRTATGKGNAGKDAMVAAAVARWSHQLATDDEADALWVAETLRREHA